MDVQCASTVDRPQCPRKPDRRVRSGPVRPGASCLIAAVLLAILPGTVDAQLPAIEDYTRGMERRDGFVPLVWDASTGRVFLEVGSGTGDFLYLTSLATGLGSNGLGLDRGQIADEYLARFTRTGRKVYLELQNPSFRAATNRTPALARSVAESFPTSTVAAFDVVAETGGRALADATSFFLQDAVGVAARLQQADQGSFRLDRDRSRIHEPRTRAFPRNTEVEAVLTFAGDNPGGQIRRHTPDPRSVTVRQHHSFVRLPDDGFRPRRFDPRIGVFATSFFDFGKGFDEDYVTRYARRHRLEKRDPGAAMSDPVEPIVYYLDRGVPEPYRSAFKEGGVWWSRVFEAAGFRDAFRIEDMPEDMDPMDARYNVIQWVHRTEAGSSIGPSFTDPRTGEIIKAAVRMDSHRSLVDYNLYAGTIPPTMGLEGQERFLGADGSLDWITTLDPNVSAVDFAMARRRQHSAHEIGHTLGLAHNFIAVSYGRASVMDYPAPLIKLTGGRVDLSDAYRPGPGAYDSIAIRYAYTPFPESEEGAGLEAIVSEAMERGLEFITNPDAGSGNSHPDATWWINGSDVLDELDRVTEVRRVLLDGFDETAIDPGEPMWRLNERFVPVYLHHRYTLDAAIKTIGGMEYRYGVRGDPLPVTEIISGDRQRRALEQVLDALQPRELAVPESILRILAPRPFGFGPDDRAFATAADPAFDQVGIARTLADMVVGGILMPERAARVVAFRDRDPSLPSLEDVVGRLVDRTFGADPGGHPVLARAVERVAADRLMDLAGNDDATPEARAGAEWGLRRIAALIGTDPGSGPEAEAHRGLVRADIQRFLERRYEGGARTDPLDPPPGTPIGSGGRPGRDPAGSDDMR